MILEREKSFPVLKGEVKNCHYLIGKTEFRESILKVIESGRPS